MVKNNKTQGSKDMNSKRAQEEIVGFTMIILIVAVVLIIFLSLSVKNPQKDTIESYEVESYLQALLQKTSDCMSSSNRYYSLEELMFKCDSAEACNDGREACDVFVKELGRVSNQSWNLGKGSPIRGYSLNATVDGEELKSISYGNKTRSSKGSSQEKMRNNKIFILEFEAYY